MNWKVIILFLVIFVVKSQCATIEDEVRNSTKFTLDWYRSSFNANENMVMSPISFRILLSLLYQSTTGETEHELRDNLYLSEKHETAVSQRLTLTKIIESPSIKVVNRVYVKEGVQLSQLFYAKALEYHSGIEQKDFTKSEETANEINQFVEEQTNHLIKNLVSPDDLDENTMVLLLNTLYFKAAWAIPFKEEDVYKETFNAIDGQKYSINFMNNEDNYNAYYSSELNAWTLILDYVYESNCKFIMILPDENSTINDVARSLNPTILNDILQYNEFQNIELFMPKFEIESDIDGNVELKKLGLISMFEKNEIHALENGPALKVSKTKQKVKIIVNTEGTEAVAASYSNIILVGGSTDSLTLSFNRPFIYMIITEDTSEPLFIGHFSQPAHKYLVHE